MLRNALIRLMGLLLAAYGVIGLFVVAVLILVGLTVFREIERAQVSLEQERDTIVASLRGVSRTFAATAEATSGFEGSLQGARASTQSAAELAVESAQTFRGVSQAMQLTIFGIQPLGGLAPGFDQMAEQMDELSGTLQVTGTLLNQNATDVRRVASELRQVRDQIASLADTIERASLLLAATQQGLLPFRMAFFGMCLLLAFQSLFSLIAGFSIARYLGILRAQQRQRRLEALAADEAPRG